MTLADEDTNSILTDNANSRQCEEASEPMQLAPPHVDPAQFATDATCSFWWPNLQSVQVAPSGDQDCDQWMRHHMVAKFSSCKWQLAPSSG